jgi:hypothetical protein
MFSRINLFIFRKPFAILVILFTVRQFAVHYMNIVQYCPQSTQYFTYYTVYFKRFLTDAVYCTTFQYNPCSQCDCAISNTAQYYLLSECFSAPELNGFRKLQYPELLPASLLKFLTRKSLKSQWIYLAPHEERIQLLGTVRSKRW